ncbi:tail fiber assembly protein [Serratia sp. IR-2025]
MMNYGFSATTGAFYVYEDRADYEANGNWPEDVTPVSTLTWERYCGQGPAGKVRGANSRGLPCWVDAPAPTKAELAEHAARQKTALMDSAARAIAPLERAVKLRMATEKEKAALTAWETYSVLLNRIDPAAAPDIAWPEVPGVA